MLAFNALYGCVVVFVVAVVAVVAATAAWLDDRPDLTADDATEVALGALAEVDVDGRAERAPTPIEHQPDDGDPIESWSVLVEVPTDAGDDQIELRVQRSAGQLVYVDDNVGPDDTQRLLTDDEFDQIGDYRDNAVFNDWVVRNGVGAGSGRIGVLQPLGHQHAEHGDRGRCARVDAGADDDQEQQ